jgi:hypothetical protein
MLEFVEVNDCDCEAEATRISALDIRIFFNVFILIRFNWAIKVIEKVGFGSK